MSTDESNIHHLYRWDAENGIYDLSLAPQRFRILRANGARTGFWLPHEDEFADFWTFDRGLMEMALTYEDVRALALPQE